MAELVKKLHFKKGTMEQLAKAYTTTAEAGIERITNNIDGLTAYVAIGAASDNRATMGRVTKGGTKAVLSSGKPPYTEDVWTNPGTYTWTCPQGVTRIRVAVCGGGGAGVGTRHTTRNITGGSGGTSMFGPLIQATGGTGGRRAGGTAGSGAEDWGVDAKSYAGVGGTPNGLNGTGWLGAWANLSGVTGFALSFTQERGWYGSSGGASDGAVQTQVSGGTGGYNAQYVDVISGTTYSIQVGGGGSAPSGNGIYGNPGNAGFVLIAYGGDI